MELDLEVVDMAKCLMLLSASGGQARKHHCFVQRYECRTCRKRFPSFQALGGHRASHSHDHGRPHDHKRQRSADRARDESTNTIGDNSKSRTYKCSICASEFSSGQALGGHMRKHRPLVSHAGNSETTSFDLNLPPVEVGEEDH